MKNNVKGFFYKVVRKLHIQELAYKVLSPFSQKSELDDPDTARRKLECFSPNQGISALRRNHILHPDWDLTIIIPAYNAEKYIETCLSSVLEQVTQYAYQVIVINDGSTDNTATILARFRNHPILSIITQDNGGAARARNRALESIRSRYIMFVDADDVLEPDAIEKLMCKAFELNSDIVEGAHYTFTDSGNKRYFTVCPPGEYQNPYGVITGFTCMKVLKSELFQFVAFPEGYWFEDTLMAMLIFPQVQRVVRINDVVYGYRTNPEGSTARANSNPKSIDSFWVTERLMRDIHSLGFTVTPRLYVQLLLQCQICFSRTSTLSESVRRSIFVLACEMAKNYDPGYTPEELWFKRLKQSLLDRNYGQYRLVCSLMVC